MSAMLVSTPLCVPHAVAAAPASSCCWLRVLMPTMPTVTLGRVNTRCSWQLPLALLLLCGCCWLLVPGSTEQTRQDTQHSGLQQGEGCI